MTDEEKAAEAAKAEEAKKVEAAKAAAATAEAEDGDEDSASDDKGETLETLKAKNAKLQEESKKRRLENKALKDKQERQDKALAILQGKDKGDIDPVVEAQKMANIKMARTLVKAEVVSLAKDAHDPALIFTAHANEFKDIEVDLENETVDVDAVKEKLDGIRKKSPFLFGTTQDGTPPVVKRNPDRNGFPGGGGLEYKQWQALLTSGDQRGAQSFYSANRMKILTQMPSNKA